MEYVLDKYFFHNLPFEVTAGTRKTIGRKVLNFIQWADWLCKYEPPSKVFQNNPYFLLVELLFLFLCLLTFLHACRHGGRHLYVWTGVTIFAFNIEFDLQFILCVSFPSMSYSFHGVLSFFGMRVPLYALIGVHQTFGYIAYVLVSRMHLPWWAEGPGVGVSSVMLLFPYRIMGTKLLWWTWHDTDPSVNDRMFWVPWGLFCFYAACMCSFVWILHLLRYILLEREYDWTKFPREILCSIFAGMLSFWLGSVQFSFFCSPLRDLFGVHSEIITILFLSCYAIIVLIADRNNLNLEARKGTRLWFDELSCAVALEYLFLMVLVVIADPSSIVSEGLHQPIGPCKEMEEVHTPVLVHNREKYLCATKYDEKYFDFHCVPNGIPKQQDGGSGKPPPLEYYAVCGTNFDNRAEYITVIWGCCILFALIFHQMAACSGSTPVDPVKSRKHVSRSFSTSSQRNVFGQKASQYSEDVHHPVISPKHDRQLTLSQSDITESMESEAVVSPALRRTMSRRKATEVPQSTRVLRSHSRL